MIKALVASLFLTMLAASAMAAQQDAAIPNLVGNWIAGTSHLHHGKQGFINIDADSAKLTVTDQKGRVFHGVVEWAGKAPGKDTFSGVIDKDNVTFYMAGHTDAVRIGKMEGPDAFTFYFLHAGGPNPRAGFVEYKRVKK
ncbi:hypothetical protein [Fundidesulfovibrio putealis]|uniref:hypothetical protein n=1 Tax=Fundidesulfovibrio putealis TaxID=270496 RepID=UPI00040C170F|nr:hypothetical protein [Fundidesulfovibrio putealis]